MLSIKTIENGFEIKNGQQKLILDGSAVKLAETIIDQPGEYEAGGVEVVYGQTAALIIWDNLQTVFVFSPERTTTFEKSQFSPCDAIVFGTTLAKLTKVYFNETLELFDPKVVVISAKTDIAEIQSTVKAESVESGKLSSQALPSEGREFILLS